MLNVAAALRLAFVLMVLMLLGVSAGARATHSAASDMPDHCHGYGIC